MAVLFRGARGRLLDACPRGGIRVVDPRDAGSDWPARLLVLSPVA